MPRRTDARKTALQMLYLIDLNPDASQEQLHHSIKQELPNPELTEFAEQIVAGVRARRSVIDSLIEKTSQNWRVGRMAPTDRNVMRLAVFEMHYLGTPSPVAINEAVELAKEFGSANSAAFVNGIIDRLTPEVLKSSPATGSGETENENSC
ncbi:MAG: transcription antitermination factor NusB [Fuerstiella sp.]|nr:transcription antitermination factor NusB [Fuerstiella sp.]